MPNVTSKNIEDLIDEWHLGDSPLKIYEYLGLSEIEYAIWVETGKLEEN